jgi:protein required for attachment to host cells
VLAAPPRALGMIRPMLSQPTIDMLRGEIGKDYVNLPMIELEERLRS